MEITEVRVKLIANKDDRLKGFCSMTLDNCFVVRDVKIIEGTNGLFVAMPSRKMADGTHKDIAHPINNETRKHIEEKVLDAYKQKISETDVEKKSAPAKTEFGGGG